MTSADPGRGADRLGVLARAVEEARAISGTILLEVAGAERRWCAACTAVQGDLELRVGEPHRGLRPWRRAPGEEWLAQHGFTHRIDAWTQPARLGATSAECAQILAGALEHGLGASPDAPLMRTLVQPGRLDQGGPPPDAPHAEHLAAAFATLLALDRGKALVEGGRPARTWASAAITENALFVLPELTDEDDGWRFPLAPESAAKAAGRLAGCLRADPAYSEDDPLFIALIDVGRGDGDGYRVPPA